MTMTNEKHRRSIRLDGFDYRNGGTYFVTICSKNKERIFVEVRNGMVGLSEYGCIAQQCWDHIPIHFPFVILDRFIVMPNHIHGIIHLNDITNRNPPVRRGTACRAPTTMDDDMKMNERHFGQSIAGSLATIIGAYKSAVTKHINILRNAPQTQIWQRNYYEHIVRTEHDLINIRRYIRNNPVTWNTDPENIV